jgi:hypothetical protein
VRDGDPAAERGRAGDGNLVILTDRRGAEVGRRLAVARSLVFSGAIWGMARRVRQWRPGTPAVTDERTGIGRNA